MDLSLDYIGKFLLEVVIMQYLVFLISLLFKKGRKEVKNRNEELDKLREKHIKTLEEQEEFINLKFPKKDPFRFTFRNVFSFLLSFIKYGFMFYIIFRIVDPIPMRFFVSFSLVVIIPIVINFILRKFRLQNDDPLVDIFRTK